jgi:hypothetical protein
MMKNHIYITTNNINGKSYVGQTNGNSASYLGSGVYLQRAIKKYGTENFTKKVLVYCEQEELDYYEPLLIAIHKTMLKEGGYNATPLARGGNNPYEGKAPEQLEETRRKQSEARKGYKMSPESIEKMRQSKTGVSVGKGVAKPNLQRSKNPNWCGISTDEMKDAVIQTGSMEKACKFLSVSARAVGERFKREGIKCIYKDGIKNGRKVKVIGFDNN